MILSGSEIEKEYSSGNIIIYPFDKKYLNPNSYNYRLGKYYKTLGSDKLNIFPENGLLIKPKKLYLCSTLEQIGSEKFVISLIGRSSVGRYGLFLQCHSDMGNLGSAHNWTLEISCIQPIILYPEMIIGQVSFWEVSGNPNKLYNDGYTKFNIPQEAILK